MSHAKNKVDWCLKKAKKEISEGKKHRGLVEVEEDIESARKHIEKAEHNLTAITYFDKGGFSDWSMSAVFYCIYHCFLVIAAKFGYESANQTCTISLMKFLKENNKIEMDEKFIALLESEEIQEVKENSVIDWREDYTYGVQISVKDEAKINELKEICKELIDITKEIIFK